MFNEDKTETKKQIHLPFMITLKCLISLKLQKITQHQKRSKCKTQPNQHKSVKNGNKNPVWKVPGQHQK